MKLKTVAEYKKMFRFKENNGEIIITGYKGTDINVVIPEKIGNGTVVAIGDNAFAAKWESVKSDAEMDVRKNIESVIVPDTVKYIGHGAFDACTNLTELSLPEEIVIEEGAFSETGYLNTKENYEDGVLYIGKCLVATQVNKAVKHFEIKEGTVSIAEGAIVRFNVETVQIPSSVRVIGAKNDRSFGAFQAITIKRIDVDEKNPNFSSVDGVLFDKEKQIIIRYPVGKEEKSYVIPSSVKHIHRNAFNFTRLESVTIPEGVVSIGFGAFDCAYSIKQLIIPDSVTEIHPHAFGIPRNVHFEICGSVDSVAAQIAKKTGAKYIVK